MNFGQLRNHREGSQVLPRTLCPEGIDASDYSGIGSLTGWGN